ncbi:ATP-dependent DNA helicase PIF1-like, partial [Paramuricea clavata]
IEIDRDVIQSLPENVIADELRYVIDENELSVHVENEGPLQDPVMSANASVAELVLGSGSTSFIPMHQRQGTEGAAIQDAVNEVDPLDWPSTEGNLVYEFKTDDLATMAFPTLFPHGKGDPTNRARQHGMTLIEAFKHLMKFAERLADDGQFHECEPNGELPIREYRDLQGDSLQWLQLRLEGKRFLIIDEMSMIGHKMLSWLDNRLRAGTGKEDIPFGGMSVILMGDFGQSPPVGDKPMYVSDQVMCQAGQDPEAVAFRALLMRMRNGEVTEEDWKLLLEHSTTSVPMDQFTDAIQLYFDKKGVAEYNYEKLLQLGQPVAKIQAKHSGHGASVATSDKAGGLDAVLFLSTKAEVMLTCNLWAEVGLCNGSFGTIEQIWFAENMGPPNLPIAVFVHFHSYTGPAFLDACSKCIPVPPKVFEWMADGKYLSRQQVPLRLRYAMTIHKSQEQTLTKAVVELCKGEKVAGCTFVAMSRVVRSIHDIVFEPMTFDRLKAIGRSRNMQKQLKAEE